jgi:hypothetical protein
VREIQGHLKGLYGTGVSPDSGLVTRPLDQPGDRRGARGSQGVAEPTAGRLLPDRLCSRPPGVGPLPWIWDWTRVWRPYDQQEQGDGHGVRNRRRSRSGAGSFR